MKVFSFKQFLEEEDTKAIVQTGINSKGLDNSVTKEIMNSRLLAATNHAYLTPYIALGNVARILAYSGITVPQYVFLDREEGEVVFDAPQFGQVAGVNIDGTPAIPKTQYFIYFSYAINEDGYYDCFAVIVDIDELDDILDEGGEMEDEADEVHDAQKLGEEAELDESKMMVDTKGSPLPYQHSSEAHMDAADFYRSRYINTLSSDPMSQKYKDSMLRHRRKAIEASMKDEEAQLGEDVDLSEGLHARQKIPTGSFVKISLLKRRDPNKHEIVGFKPGSDPSGNLDSYTVRAHLREPNSRTKFTPVSSTRDVAASTIHKLNPSMHEEKVNEEQIDEISTALKNRYVKAATRDRDLATRLAGHSAGEAKELKDKDPKRSKDFDSEVGLYKRVAAKRQAGIDLAKKKVNESKMKWRAFGKSHSEPSERQDTMDGHLAAADWHNQQRILARGEGDTQRQRYHADQMDYHNGMVHTMKRQGFKEEATEIKKK